MILTAIFFVALTSILVLGFVNPVVKQTKITSDLWNTKKAFYLGESGANDVVYRVKSGFTVNSGDALPILNSRVGDSVLTYVTNNLDGSQTMVTKSNVDGYIRETQVTMKKGDGVSFNYGLQTGQGGFLFNNSGTINGNVYSNGDIISTNSSAKINGTAIVANSPSLFTDQQNIDPFSPPNSIIFGTTTLFQDEAQSFIISSSSPLTQINIFIKKTGSPSDITVKIIKDSSGNPSDNSGDVVSSATLNASLVTTSYGWVEVPLIVNPQLTVGNKYWIVLDTSSNASNYYIIGANLDNSYPGGTSMTGKIGGSWSNTGYDSYFKIFLGGSFGRIIGVNQWNQFGISGGAWAHTINAVNSGSFMRCQLGSTPVNNKVCDTSYADPTPSSMPISDANIADWKATALAGGTINGDFDSGTYQNFSLGPKKINGNLIIGGSSSVTVTGTLWVTGNIILAGSGKLQLSSSYGTNSGVIVTDGKIVVPGSCTANGSGQTGSYIMLVTTSDCPTSSSCGGSNAVEMTGSGGAVVINAQRGTVNFSGSATANEVTAYKVVISGGGVILNYNSGLANQNFSSGPTGSVRVTDWRELEQ